MTYEEIQDFFRKKSVTPPDRDFYNSIVDKINTEKERDEKLKNIQLDSKANKTVKVEKQKVSSKEEEPKKRKRRRSKKSE